MSYIMSFLKFAAGFLLPLILPVSLAWSQGPLSDSERDHYFDDNKISTSRHTLKIDIFPLIQKELALNWEYAYHRHNSLETSIGYLRPGYHHSWITLISGITDDIELYPGAFSVSLQNRFYYKPGFKSQYANVGIKHRRFSTMASTDFLVGTGYQWLFHDRLKFDLNFSIGWRRKVRKENDSYGVQDFDKFTIDLPLSVKL
jgi:hypothetical protein